MLKWWGQRWRSKLEEELDTVKVLWMMTALLVEVRSQEGCCRRREASRRREGRVKAAWRRRGIIRRSCNFRVGKEMQRESRHRNYFPFLSGYTEQSWTKKWDWWRQNFATSIVALGLGPRRSNVVFSAFLLQIHIHGVWCVEVMSPDASQHDLSLLIASGNATETQYTDICIIVCL